MLLIPCPWCGPRESLEFSYGGEADRPRPADPSALSDAEWAAFVFQRRNPEGPHAELWHHVAGCRRWLRLVRDTASHAILDSGPPVAEPPR